MAASFHIEGVREVVAGLKKATIRQGKGLERGLKKAGLRLQRESQIIVPIKWGNLRNSAFTRKVEGTSGLNTVVRVGYTAAYAIYVHERTELRHKEGKSAKFLEIPLRNKRHILIKIISTEMEKTT